MADWVILLMLFPLICGVIGYLTNVVAVKMIFRPHERVEVLGIGFQGVLAKHQEHFARMLAAVIVRDLVSAGDLVEELAKPKAVDQLEGAAKSMASALVDDLRAQLPEGKQALLGEATVNALLGQVAVAMRAEVPTIIAHLKAEADARLDLEEIVAQKLISLGAKGLEDVIYEISSRELTFIEIYGAVFGALLGFFQFGVLWLLGDVALPIVGALVGTVTNWLAIQMLFYPKQKKRYLGLIEYQGMFPARQAEIAAGLGAVSARDFIVPTEIFKDLADGVVPNALEDVHADAAEGWLREKIPPLGQVIDGMLNEDERGTVRRGAMQSFPELKATGLGELASVAGDNVDVSGILTSRLSAMDKDGFEGIIRGLFEREELYLIIYGGLLGGIMGFLQLLVVLGLR